jgi:hypothetical protein
VAGGNERISENENEQLYGFIPIKVNVNKIHLLIYFQGNFSLTTSFTAIRGWESIQSSTASVNKNDIATIPTT